MLVLLELPILGLHPFWRAHIPILVLGRCSDPRNISCTFLVFPSKIIQNPHLPSGPQVAGGLHLLPQEPAGSGPKRFGHISGATGGESPAPEAAAVDQGHSSFGGDRVQEYHTA